MVPTLHLILLYTQVGLWSTVWD